MSQITSAAQKPPVVLTVAGSDPSGGAGIEADLKVITAHQCYGMTAITALTAQNTQKVYNIHETPVEFFRQSLETVFADIVPDAIKTGMLGSAAHITALVDVLKASESTPKLVVDPVMISTSGSQLLANDALNAVVEKLLPLADIVTPNYPEAVLLAKTAGPLQDFEVKDVEGLTNLAKLLQSLGPKMVLLKGGHCAFNADGVVTDIEAEKKTVVDVFYDGSEVTLIKNTYVSSEHTHGTGCSLSAAIASNLALGDPPATACRKATQYVNAGILHAPGLGHGKGPIGHLHSTYTLPYAPNTFVDYLLSHPRIAPEWKLYTQHPFVLALGDGTLPADVFQHYLIQDYLFLLQFSRATALAAAKSAQPARLFANARALLAIEHELTLHTTLCTEYGLDPRQLQHAEESPATTAYTRYVLDVGHSSDEFLLQVAMASCCIGYGVIAELLLARPETVRGPGNRYWKWIEMYSSEEYRKVVRDMRAYLEKEARGLGRGRVEECVEVFRRATIMEERFWGWAMGAGGVGLVMGP